MFILDNAIIKVCENAFTICPFSRNLHIKLCTSHSFNPKMFKRAGQHSYDITSKGTPPNDKPYVRLKINGFWQKV